MRMFLAPTLFALACQPQDEPQLGGSGGSSAGSADETDPSVCPAGMVQVAPDGFTAVVGETSASSVDAFAGTIIPALSLQVESFCMAAYPLPGAVRDTWMSDGLNVGHAELLDDLLPTYGRRLCTTAELLIAAAGPNNQPFPFGFEYRTGACDPEAFSPSVMGSFEGCDSPYGARDFLVRSSWAVLDEDVRAAVEPGRGEGGFPGDGIYAIYGGTAQRDTFFSPDNYGVHFYGPNDYSTGTPAYVTDDVRVCADLGTLDDETELAWTEWTDSLRASGTYADVLGPGLDLSR